MVKIVFFSPNIPRFRLIESGSGEGSGDCQSVYPQEQNFENRLALKLDTLEL